MSQIIEITDFEASELDVFARLSEGQLLNRHEPEKGLFIGKHVFDFNFDFVSSIDRSFLDRTFFLEKQRRKECCRSSGSGSDE